MRICKCDFCGNEIPEDQGYSITFVRGKAYLGDEYDNKDICRNCLDTLMNREKSEHCTPCDVCKFDPPSSGDKKPCSMCPAEAADNSKRE